MHRSGVRVSGGSAPGRLRRVRADAPILPYSRPDLETGQYPQHECRGRHSPSTPPAVRVRRRRTTGRHRGRGRRRRAGRGLRSSGAVRPRSAGGGGRAGRVRARMPRRRTTAVLRGVRRWPGSGLRAPGGRSPGSRCGAAAGRGEAPVTCPPSQSVRDRRGEAVRGVDVQRPRLAVRRAGADRSRGVARDTHVQVAPRGTGAGGTPPGTGPTAQAVVRFLRTA